MTACFDNVCQESYDDFITSIGGVDAFYNTYPTVINPDITPPGPDGLGT